MPIRPELRHFYGSAWRATRVRILERAKNRCEQCGKPNLKTVWVYRSEACGQYWSPTIHAQSWTSCLFGGGLNFRLTAAETRAAFRSGQVRTIRVVLTIAHLNHIAGDDRDENLLALCSWCHLHYDREHHAETRSARKDRQRPLLAEARA